MKRKLVKIAADGLAYAFALVLAYWIRFDGRPPDFELRQMSLWLPIVVAVRLLISRGLGVHRQVWRYASLFDCLALAFGAAAMSAVLAILRMFLTPEYQILRPALGVIGADYMLAVGLTCGMRILTRIIYEYRVGRHVVLPKGQADANVLLVGAGMAGIMAAKEIRGNRRLQWHVIGFVDDDPAKQNNAIHGLRVLGTTQDLPHLVSENHVSKVIVTIASASARQIRRIVDICDAIPVQTQIIPSLLEMVEGREDIGKVRDVRIDDLLGRSVVRATESATEMSLCFRNRIILITGAGGSIGSELCRQVSVLSPRILVMIDKDENGLFETSIEMRQRFPHVSTRMFVADLRNPQRLAALFADFHPEVVFHAAAHKHVPIMEENVYEAIDNNIFGTLNLLQCCENFSVGRFVMLSTDKAVNCANVIGATKRIAEIYIQKQAGGSQVKYGCVRFGNVLGSRGSVVPLFQNQIRNGGPLTITHPEATRYFMTIPEASQLVIQTATLCEKGEIFILEMGKPVRILDLARDMIRLSGVKEASIEIKYTGLRPGEKIHEELVHADERTRPTKYDRILLADPMPVRYAEFDAAMEKLRQAQASDRSENLRQLLMAAAKAGQDGVN